MFDAQRDQVLAALKGQKSIVKRDVDDLYDKAAWDAALAAAILPVYEELVPQAGQEALSMVADAGFSQTAAIAKYFETRPGLVSVYVNAETDKQLRATLTEGINAGESMAELADRVTQVFGALAGFRAERIARTETITASSFASIEGWLQSGVVEAKEWFTAGDERVCPFCRAMQGRVTALNENYFNKGDVMELPDGNRMKLDYSDIQGPSLHPNCRCVLLPVLRSDA